MVNPDEALQIADDLEAGHAEMTGLAVAELRRLHAENEALRSENRVLVRQNGEWQRVQVAERERIKAAVNRCVLRAEDCEGDGPEVDEARKALACTILAAIAGYEAPEPAGTQQGLFVA